VISKNPIAPELVATSTTPVAWEHHHHHHHHHILCVEYSIESGTGAYNMEPLAQYSAAPRHWHEVWVSRQAWVKVCRTL